MSVRSLVTNTPSAASAIEHLADENELMDEVLPQWHGPGRQYLECLICAYSVAREYRNHFVHGIYSTVGTSTPPSAHAGVLPPMPWNNETQVPTYISVADMRPIAEHFHDLAMFAHEVMVCFGERGERALNPDGSPAVEQLPA